MPRNISYTVPEEYDGRKVIHFLRGYCGFSSRLMRKVKYALTLNGNQSRTIDRIKPGDIIGVSIPDDDAVPEITEAEIDIVYEDDDILVINKSPFMAMHPTHNHQGDTLANAVTAYLTKKGKCVAFRAVGRLDKGTSGIVVCAINPLSACKLSGKIGKEYAALVKGELKGEGRVDVPIYRPDPMKTLRAVGEEGDRAVTHYSVEAYDEKRSVLRVRLETGRTHQIRVHFAWLGAPLVGDDMYGRADGEISRHALHCEKMTFTHPVTGESISVTAPLWEDMEKIKEKIVAKY